MNNLSLTCLFLNTKIVQKSYFNTYLFDSKTLIRSGIALATRGINVDSGTAIKATILTSVVYFTNVFDHAALIRSDPKKEKRR